MNIQKITFGNGCFWCTEAIFETLKGVKSLVSGYMGGHTENPTYKDVCNGNTGHAEVIQIEYDADVISFVSYRRTKATVGSYDKKSYRGGNF
ncbi:MAG: peptide-methionine (S)-S-oxide reductase [Mucilaginibacter sp.]